MLLQFLYARCWSVLSIVLAAGTLSALGCQNDRQLQGVVQIEQEDSGQKTVKATVPSSVEADVALPTSETVNADQAVAVVKKATGGMKGMMAAPKPSDIVFKDQVQSNTDVPESLKQLKFFDTEGKQIDLQDYLGKKNIVLVFTEGFAGGMLCPFCKTQTSRLVANYDRFKELDSEVFVVYPGSRDHLEEFIEAAKKTEKKQVDEVPFPLLLDEDMDAVNYFNILSNLAHPSTFIIDKNEDVKLAYVGADMTADRPSIDAMLRILGGDGSK